MGGAGHMHPGGLNVVCGSPGTGPTRGGRRRPPPEVRQAVSLRAHYYEPAGAVSWDVSMEATRPGLAHPPKGRRHGLDRRRLRRQARRRGTSRWGSCRSVPHAATLRRGTRSTTQGRCRRCTRGRRPHAWPPAREHRPARRGRTSRLPDPRDLRSKAGGARHRASRSTASSTRSAATRRGSRLPPTLMRPPVVRPGGSVTFTSLDALPSMPLSEQAWHNGHLVQAALQPRPRNRLPARGRSDQVRLGPARLRDAARARRSRPAPTSTRRPR